jgi:dTDP-4-amino-4,6-dideoxygalactose transaminase
VSGDRPAVLGGTPIRAGKAWPSWPQWDATERAALLAALDEGAWWAGAGSRAQGFADAFAEFQGARRGLPCTNGTHAIEAALHACGVGDGHEVIVPGLTFVATATAVLATNAVPVLVDVEPGSLNLDVAAAEEAITDRTRAILAVHVAGNACDLDALSSLCADRGIHLVEDCAHAHGTMWRGRGAGSYGSFGCFSMQASKLMTAGEGGVLIGNDDSLMARAWSYSNCGRVPGEHWYHHPGYGSNLRMTEWQGAILGAQLARFPDQHRRRNAAAAALNEAIAQIPGLAPQARDARTDSQGYYCWVCHYDADAFAGLPLAALERALAAEGVPLDVSYPALNTLALFRTNNFAPRFARPPRDYSAVSLPNAEHAAASTVWMEHRVLLADVDDVLDVARALERIQRHAGEIARKAGA